MWSQIVTTLTTVLYRINLEVADCDLKKELKIKKENYGKKQKNY
jgi:hypothetical protein